jgi:copper chaperone CopZ
VKTVSLELPAMYADHHVVEVRRLLMALPGVTDVYASSGFQVAEVEFDESKLNREQIEAALEEAGYLGDLQFAVEKGAYGDRENGDRPFFRKSAVHVQAGPSLSFAQKVPFTGRPLWPCPGMGPLVTNKKEMTNG